MTDTYPPPDDRLLRWMYHTRRLTPRSALILGGPLLLWAALVMTTSIYIGGLIAPDGGRGRRLAEDLAAMSLTVVTLAAYALEARRRVRRYARRTREEFWADPGVELDLVMEAEQRLYATDHRLRYSLERAAEDVREVLDDARADSVLDDLLDTLAREIEEEFAGHGMVVNRLWLTAYLGGHMSRRAESDNAGGEVGPGGHSEDDLHVAALCRVAQRHGVLP